MYGATNVVYKAAMQDLDHQNVLVNCLFICHHILPTYPERAML